MAFKGITFAGQNVTPKNDGGLYQAHYGDGILWGCGMNISGDDLVIQSGEFIMGGRYVQVDGATNVDLSGRTLQTGYIQVIMNADLTQGEGNQWYPTFVESATTTFPALTQDDINDTGTLYQFELAVVQISGGNLTNIISTSRGSSVITRDLEAGNYCVFFSGDSGAGFRQYLPDGTSPGGISVFNSTAMQIYSGGYGVVINPNGLSNPSGQVSFTVQGQQIGGHLIQENHRTNSQSCGSGTNTQVASISSLATAGIYQASGFITYTPSSSSAIYPRLTITGSGSSHIYYQNAFSNSSASKSISMSGVVTGYNQYQLVFNISGGGTVTEAYLNLCRLA